MPTITASDFRNGVTFEMDGQVMQVVWRLMNKEV